MKIAVVVFPGSNCDIDLYEALHTVCGADVDYVTHKESSLAGYDAVMLPGGFSYGDYLRSGAIARFSNIMGAVKQMADEGKPVFGTCNGFQILTEVTWIRRHAVHILFQILASKTQWITSVDNLHDQVTALNHTP